MKKSGLLRALSALFLFLLPILLKGQGRLEGKVSDAMDQDELGLPGANVVWAGTTVGTSTNNAGYFSLKRVRNSDRLVISFIGYRTDTITVGRDEEYITHKLHQNNETAEITVTAKASGSFISQIDPALTVHITSAELRKAPCCNLSESFATNASVDVNYSDAASGAKQIQLLGLAGIYTQILTENIPAVYGLSTAYGLNYIPGPWMEMIQVSKGSSSVRNGYESVAGQINVEFKKPATSEKLFVNGFVSNAGRQELNANTSVILSKKLSTMIMAHSELQNNNRDHNMDGFRDEPDIRQYHFFNRWDYMTGKYTFRAGIRYLGEERLGGQFIYNRKSPDTWSNGFGININTRRFEAFTKTGILFSKDQSMSFGWINNFAWHDQNSFFGRRFYDGNQKAYYSSLLYQWTPANSKQIIDAGLSYKYDLYDEQLDTVLLGRKESVPGIFAQYTYADSAGLTLVAGIRADFHNLFGTLITPRLHLRYALSPAITVRASAGKGFRAGNILAENSYLLASSRTMKIDNNLKIEEAWNSGLSLTGKIPVSGKILKLSGEYFHTEFMNQVIVDLDATTDEIRFYNLDGRSFSNVFQVELSAAPVDGLDLLAAWRWNDVRMTIDNVLRDKPLTSRYKGLLSASWLTRLRKWQFDYTLQLNGPGRIPSTAANPEIYRRSDHFGAFTLMNIQITRNFKKWHFYAGAENLTDFRQPEPVIAADDPFGDYFDSGLIWGPVHGRKIYAGFRFILNKDL